MEFYSQFEQDKWLYNNIFKNKKDGYFVDIGAHDGVHCSNTYLFEKLGWSGVCFEPSPSRFLQLNNNRSCKNINAVISQFEEEMVDFCEIDGYCEMLSGIVNNYDEEHKRRIIMEERVGGGSTRKNIKVKNYKFNNIIKATHIDILDIDTEGGEIHILKTIDFNKYNINIILVECNYNSTELKDFLDSKGYREVVSLGCDKIFQQIKK